MKAFWFTRIQEDLQENNKKMDIQGYIIDHWLGKMSAELCELYW